MNEFWGITILLFLILTVFAAFIIRVMGYWSRYHQTRHPRARFTDRAPTLKSGDIILYIAHTHGFTNSLFTNDLYTHSSMVVEKGGEFFLSEATCDSVPDPSTGEEICLPECAQMNPLVTRLKYYPGMMFLMPLKKPLTAEQTAILQERALEEAPYPSMGQMALAFLRFPTHKKARHCMQHIAWLIDEIGLTPTELEEGGRRILESGFFGSSRAITTLPGKPLGSDGMANEYGEIYELLFDLDAE